MKGFLRLILGYLVADLLTLMCRAQEKAGQHLGSIVVLSGGNHSSFGEHGGDASEPPPTPDHCLGYFDVMGQWDPPFNCSSGEFIFCCGTCGFRFCCKFRKTRLDQNICTNYEKPPWMITGNTPAHPKDPLHDPTKDKTNLIVYIICGVVAVMVLVGIFTKLGLEKAHRPQREHMSRALADVMRPQGPCTTDHMERDLNIVVHVQHYDNMETRPPANNLRKLHYVLLGCMRTPGAHPPPPIHRAIRQNGGGSMGGEGCTPVGKGVHTHPPTQQRGVKTAKDTIGQVT
uniref:Shisa family member 9 n=1 Tax=Sphenodon punctatus TaxID=8508 RepID=A0A8D0GQ51_SPHPU